MLTDVHAVRPNAEAMLAAATHREPMKTADSLSSATFERLVIGGERFVVKYVSTGNDWITRATGDVACRPLWLWRTGTLDLLPDRIDPLVVDAAHDAATGVTALLMPDVSELFVPEGSGTLPLEQHHRFIDHMAALHAAFWNWQGPADLMPMANRYTVLAPMTAQVEAELGHPDGVPSILVALWQHLGVVAPEMADVALALTYQPDVLIDALMETPMTLVHGDWKAGNLGSRPDGRTIVVDWAIPGLAPGCVDLAWYLAVNCDRLPEPKEATIACYREALGRHGIDVAGWFDRQLELALLGAFVQLGWSKTNGLPELQWWVDRVTPTARDLLR
ncbi:MAG TPA: phosphotransferase [Acidothermaceae bacterium]